MAVCKEPSELMAFLGDNGLIYRYNRAAKCFLPDRELTEDAWLNEPFTKEELAAINACGENSEPW